MRVYKFKDLADKKFAFIAAKDQEQAETALRQLTSIPFKLVESKGIEEIDRPVVLMNDILPF